MNIIDGIEISNKILNKIKKEISLKGIKPGLHIIYIGNNDSSKVYIDKKIEAGRMVGIEVFLDHFDHIEEDDLVSLIKELSQDTKCNGIIIQLPAPSINLSKLLPLIPLNKDVDGLNPNTLGLLWHNSNAFIPATAKAIMYVIEEIANKEGVDINSFLKGKNVLIINRSILIGKPLSSILLKYDSTITVAHSKTSNLDELVLRSDIVISATGVRGLLDGLKFKDKASLIDAGFKKEGNSIFGDINIDNIKGDIAYLSPVPNGVGPIGVACLLDNTYEAYLKAQ